MSLPLSYSDVPDIGRPCRCQRAPRVYAAISRSLNEHALSGSATDRNLRPYVFKVGYTGNNCHDRWGSLNEDRKARVVGGAVVYDEPRYAGVGDWKFLRCWPVDTRRYDDAKFKPWLRKSRFRHVVRGIPRYTTPETAGMPADKGFRDLFVMARAHAESLCPVQVNDPLGEQILGVVAEAVSLLVGEYASGVGV